MPVSLLRIFGFSRSAERLWVRPERADWLASLGLTTARDFLALPGVVVSGHVGRNVSRVRLGETTAYLKREHRVRWRDRFRSWCDGFGWSSISAREAAVLRRLDERDPPGPKWLAYGESEGQGFLLLEESANSVDLRSLPVVDDDLAERLGEVIARIHAAGIDQPDLFAKHVLVGRRSRGPHPPNPPLRSGEGGTEPASSSPLSASERGVRGVRSAASPPALTILDWQRAALRKRVTFRQRVHTLASLRATASTDLLPDANWHRLVAAYLRTDGNDRMANADQWLAAIERVTAHMLCRKTIRAQRLPAGPAVNQELVRIDGETVCAIPEVAPLFADPAAIARAYDPANNGKPVPLPNRRTGLLRVSRHALPLARWFAALRGRPWRSPELKLARLLFHLERQGIPAPNLLAYGQTVPIFAAAGSFVLCEPLAADRLRREHEGAALAMLDRLHAAECRLTDVGPSGEPFGVIAGHVVIRDATRLRLTRRLSRKMMERDRARLRDFFRGLA